MAPQERITHCCLHNFKLPMTTAMVCRGEEGVWVGCGKMQYEEKRAKDKSERD